MTLIMVVALALTPLLAKDNEPVKRPRSQELFDGLAQEGATLTARCNSLSNGRYGHPEQDRAISLREAASLQTFSDAYVFYGLSQRVARQIGNAVQVRFAERPGARLMGMK